MRHSNVGVLTNEQLVVATQIDVDKWEDLLDNLRKDLGDSTAQFAIVYLFDDFIGTGSSFIRYDEEKGGWKGKMMRFFKSAQLAAKTNPPFEKNSMLCIHHYIASHKGVDTIKLHVDKSKDSIDTQKWFSKVHFSFGMVLPHDFPAFDADKNANANLIELTKKYYDPIIQTKHTDVGGVEHFRAWLWRLCIASNT